MCRGIFKKLKMTISSRKKLRLSKSFFNFQGTYDRIQRVQYDLPADTPPATRALISALLQRVPSNRPNADQV